MYRQDDDAAIRPAEGFSSECKYYGDKFGRVYYVEAKCVHLRIEKGGLNDNTERYQGYNG